MTEAGQEMKLLIITTGPGKEIEAKDAQCEKAVLLVLRSLELCSNATA
jgi:hypothetical protein